MFHELSRIADSPLPVNIETDCIVRAVVHWLERREEPEAIHLSDRRETYR